MEIVSIPLKKRKAYELPPIQFLLKKPKLEGQKACKDCDNPIGADAVFCFACEMEVCGSCHSVFWHNMCVPEIEMEGLHYVVCRQCLVQGKPQK